jgi:hypothetical protein
VSSVFAEIKSFVRDAAKILSERIGTASDTPFRYLLTYSQDRTKRKRARTAEREPVANTAEADLRLWRIGRYSRKFRDDWRRPVNKGLASPESLSHNEGMKTRPLDLENVNDNLPVEHELVLTQCGKALKEVTVLDLDRRWVKNQIESPASVSLSNQSSARSPRDHSGDWGNVPPDCSEIVSTRHLLKGKPDSSS